MASHTSLPSTLTNVDLPLLFSMKQEPSLTGSSSYLHPLSVQRFLTPLLLQSYPHHHHSLQEPLPVRAGG